jgi:hypothetical protein
VRVVLGARGDCLGDLLDFIGKGLSVRTLTELPIGRFPGERLLVSVWSGQELPPFLGLLQEVGEFVLGDGILGHSGREAVHWQSIAINTELLFALGIRNSVKSILRVLSREVIHRLSS